MPANNNTTSLNEETTSLNMGVVGQRQFSDYNATEISGAISRENYKLQMKSNDKMKDFSEAVYKIVQGYAYEDKINIITEYGDGSKLKGNMDEESINQLCTECMIIHLDPSTLKQLMADLATKEAVLRREVREKQKRTRTFIGFNTNSFESVYKQIKDMKKSDYDKAIKNVDDAYHIPKYLKNQYPKLRKELYDVLQTCYNKIEISRLAREMDIDTPPGTSYKALYKWIINKTVLYVSLIIGESKTADIGNTIINAAPFEELLQYTSYSYVTGKPGLDPNEWAEKKEAARIAKKAIAERMKMQRKKRDTFSKITKSKEFSVVTGGVRTKSVWGAGRALKKIDLGVLKDATTTELVQLAGKYGVDPAINDIGKLKAKIYAAMAVEVKDINKLSKKKENLLTEGKINRDINDKLAIHGVDNYNQLLGSPTLTQKADITQTIDGQVPTIRLFRNGKLRTKFILSAVPVYIVGQGLSGDNRKQNEINDEKEKQKKLKNLLSIKKKEINEPNKDIYKAIKKINKKRKQGKILTPTERINEKKYNKQIEEYKKDKKDEKIRLKAIKSRDNATILGNIDVNITEDDLGDYERKLLRYFKQLTVDDTLLLNGEKPTKNLENLEKVAYILNTDYGYSSHLTDSIISNIPKTEDDHYDNNRLLDAQLRFCWLYAKATGVTKLAGYLTKEYQIIYKNTSLGKSIKSGLIKATGIGAIVKHIKQNAINNRTAEIAGDITDTTSVEDVTEIESPLAIPKISRSKISFDNNNNIDEVVPVYDIATGRILNTIKELNEKKIKDKKENEEENNKDDINKNINITAGIGQNHILTGNPKDNSVIFNTSINDVLQKMKNAGYNIEENEKNGTISKIFSDANKEENKDLEEYSKQNNKHYKIKTSDLEFIKNNNLDVISPKFATGGAGLLKQEPTSIIVGDSLKENKPNPELVTMTEKGFSVNPIKKGPENGNSNLALDSENKVNPVNPIKKGPENGNSNLALDSENKVDNFKIDNPKIDIDRKPKFATGGYSLLKQKNPDKPSLFQQIADIFLKEKDEIKISDLTGDIKKIKENLAEKKYLREITKDIWKGPAIPVLSLNKNNTDDILAAINGVSSTIKSQFADLMIGLGAGFELAAPMGVGKGLMTGMLVQGIKNKVLNTAEDVINVAGETIGDAFGASTGGIIKAPKAASGGTISQSAIDNTLKKEGLPNIISAPKINTNKNDEPPINSVITGDASGTNIFKGGAKPELVQSSGDIKVTPLNKEGEEHTSKVSRMSSTERKQALATSVASHIVKFSYKMPDGVNEISNSGEAVKVYPVKPGITDEIIVGNVTTTMAEMIMAIYNQLVSMGTISAANSELLSTIASTSAASLKSNVTNNGNIFTDAGGFTSNLDDILGGN